MNYRRATPGNIRKAAAVIRRGGVAAFPTETVYGLGADGLNPEACARVFEIKGRPRFDPLILHAATLRQALGLFRRPPAAALRLMKKFWPGPLTLVLPKSPAVPDIVTAGLKTVAVRVPAAPAALALIKAAGRPIAAPSANKFGRLSPTTAAHVRRQLGNAPDIILDGGPARIGVESTIITFKGGRPVLLRPGGLPLEEIEKACGRKAARGTESEKAPAAPGCLKKHYAPAARLVLTGPRRRPKPGPAAAYLALAARPAGKYRAVRVLSPTGDLREAAANLFGALHDLERSGAKTIYAETVPERGLGRAIMDRLRRASAR